MDPEFGSAQFQRYLADELSKAFDHGIPVADALRLARRAYEQHFRSQVTGSADCKIYPLSFPPQE